MLSALEDSVMEIEATQMIQVFMDGPNTNFKVLEEYQKKRVAGELLQFFEHATSTGPMVHLRQEWLESQKTSERCTQHPL